MLEVDPDNRYFKVLKNVCRFVGAMKMILKAYRSKHGSRVGDNEASDYHEGNSIDNETMFSRRSIWEEEGKQEEAKKIPVRYSLFDLIKISKCQI